MSCATITPVGNDPTLFPRVGMYFGTSLASLGAYMNPLRQSVRV